MNGQDQEREPAAIDVYNTVVDLYTQLLVTYPGIIPRIIDNARAVGYKEGYAEGYNTGVREEADRHVAPVNPRGVPKK